MKTRARCQIRKWPLTNSGDVLLVFEVRGLVDKHPDYKFKVSNEYTPVRE
jgi:hypothetical protein